MSEDDVFVYHLKGIFDIMSDQNDGKSPLAHLTDELEAVTRFGNAQRRKGFVKEGYSSSPMKKPSQNYRYRCPPDNNPILALTE